MWYAEIFRISFENNWVINKRPPSAEKENACVCTADRSHHVAGEHDDFDDFKPPHESVPRLYQRRSKCFAFFLTGSTFKVATAIFIVFIGDSLYMCKQAKRVASKFKTTCWNKQANEIKTAVLCVRMFNSRAFTRRKAVVKCHMNCNRTYLIDGDVYLPRLF